MKRITTLLSLLFFMSQANAQDIYDDALTAASYAYSHSKKAHGANNVFHTQEYADKAVEAFEKVETLAEKCGCEDANETAYEAKTQMISALDQDTYERSRYYAKQAKELSPKLLKQLTNCQVRKERKQKKERIKFEQLRAAELEEQSLIKSKAEKALKKLEIAISELSVVFDDQSMFEAEKGYLRSENELKNETLNDTKTFYVNRAKQLTESAMQQFISYSKN